MVVNIRHEIRLPHHSIVLLGDQPLVLEDDTSARKMAVTMFAKPNRICILDTPSGTGSPGFKQIVPPDFERPLQAEGTVLKHRGSAAIVQTRDCPTLVLCDTRSNDAVVTHAGRPALTPSFSVLDIAYQNLLGNEQPGPHLHAFILGSICGHCFVHEGPGAEKYVVPFDRYGPSIFTDRPKGALDLVAHITRQLVWRGIPLQNIHHDGLCPKEDLGLSSRRGNRTTTKNTVIVVRH